MTWINSDKYSLEDNLIFGLLDRLEVGTYELTEDIVDNPFRDKRCINDWKRLKYLDKNKVRFVVYLEDLNDKNSKVCMIYYDNDDGGYVLCRDLEFLEYFIPKIKNINGKPLEEIIKNKNIKTILEKLIQYKHRNITTNGRYIIKNKGERKMSNTIKIKSEHFEYETILNKWDGNTYDDVGSCLHVILDDVDEKLKPIFELKVQGILELIDVLASDGYNILDPKFLKGIDEAIDIIKQIPAKEQ